MVISNTRQIVTNVNKKKTSFVNHDLSLANYYTLKKKKKMTSHEKKTNDQYNCRFIFVVVVFFSSYDYLTRKTEGSEASSPRAVGDAGGGIGARRERAAATSPKHADRPRALRRSSALRLLRAFSRALRRARSAHVHLGAPLAMPALVGVCPPSSTLCKFFFGFSFFYVYYIYFGGRHGYLYMVGGYILTTV